MASAAQAPARPGLPQVAAALIFDHPKNSPPPETAVSHLALAPRNLAFLASLLLVLPLLLSLLPGVSFVGVAHARPAPNPRPRPNPPNSPHHRERSSSLEDLRQDLDNRYHADTPRNSGHEPVHHRATPTSPKKSSEVRGAERAHHHRGRR
ncbi:hypothetical protein DFJ73DRAFT_926159 [Zopfochytrium polystomum]|nr:hypothetical protein DFJ73DRAFT_926159 [Zopfochytrium polystomum]